jgi:hypothetical protein
VALMKEGRTRVLLANLTAQPQLVTVREVGARVSLRVLDESNAIEAMQSPEAFRTRQGEWVTTPGGILELALKPFAYACVDAA